MTLLDPGRKPRVPGKCGPTALLLAVVFVACVALSAVGVVQLWELSAAEEVSKSVPSPSPQAPPTAPRGE